jgi:antitoxin component YwqK of YwqJK toxin-antitoxin module
MALINCPECQKEISDSSKNCIGCGKYLNNNSNKMKKFCWIPFVILAVIAIVAISDTNSFNLDSTEDLIGNKLAEIPRNISGNPFSFDETNKVHRVETNIAYDAKDNRLGSFSNSGEREGNWKLYYNDNTLASEGNYSVGFRNGYFKHYYKNGILCHEGAYLNGSHELNPNSGIPQSGRTGLHIFYFDNGALETKSNSEKVSYMAHMKVGTQME